MKLVAAILLLAIAAPARAQYPEAVAAAFCDADGRGARLRGGPSSGELAGLVAWEFEPAWDRLFLISGYELNPVRVDEEEIEIEVRYTVVAEISGEGVRSEGRIEVARLRLARAGRSWRVIGPPPVPRLYASRFDADPLFDQLMPSNGDYVSSSKFVWRMYQAAGWSVPYQTAADFLRAGYFRAVAEPAVADVVAYLDGGAPYHLGIYEGEDRVASATVGGVLRLSLNAFAGEVRYLRLTRAAQPTPTLGPGALDAGEVETPAAADASEAAPPPPPAEPGQLEETTPPVSFEGESAATGLVGEIDLLAAREAELSERLKRALRSSGRTVSENGLPVRVDTPEQTSIEELKQEIDATRLRRHQLERALESLTPGAPETAPDDLEMLEETAPRRPVTAE